MPADVRLAIVGNPVDHSLSPVMHLEALRMSGLEGQYERRQVRDATELRVEIDFMRRYGYRGFNVTAPLKEVAATLMDLRSDAAAIGAVNTAVAVPKPDFGIGGFAGHNTDATGFRRLLDLDDRPAGNAVVIGAGGAARACVHVLLSAGWGVTVGNRTVARARAAFGDRARVVSLDHVDLGEAVASAALLVNASSAGMSAPEYSPLPDGTVLDRDLTVLDLVYVPAETKLLRSAREQGCRVLDGLQFLAAQAADSFFLWTGLRLEDASFLTAAVEGLGSHMNKAADFHAVGDGA